MTVDEKLEALRMANMRLAETMANVIDIITRIVIKMDALEHDTTTRANRPH